MPVGCWTHDFLERKGFEHIEKNDVAADGQWEASYTRCTAMMEWEGYDKPDGTQYTRCEGAAKVGQRRCEYCRYTPPIYTPFSVFPIKYGEEDDKAPVPGHHNNELAVLAGNKRAKQ